MITSTQNTKLKLVRTLMGLSRERRQHAAFVAEGVRLVEEALEAGWTFRFVLVSGELNAHGLTLAHALEERGTQVEQVDERLMKAVSETEHSQGILAVLEQSRLPVPEQPSFLLIADQLRDPGNLGTLLRTAEAAGAQAVLLSPHTTDAFAPKVVRAGMGAHFRLPIHALDWDEISKMVAGLEIYLAEMETGIPCWHADFIRPLALIVGGEAQGGSKQARTLATQKVFIPMMGKTESLNAGIAGAILSYEVLRQRATGIPTKRTEKSEQVEDRSEN